MLFHYILTLSKATVILDLFSKTHKNDYFLGDIKTTVVYNISYDIKILKSQCYLEETIILMPLLFKTYIIAMVKSKIMITALITD